MTLATAIAALLLWGGTGGRASAQAYSPQYLKEGHIDNVYGAGESKTLPAGFIGPIDIYGNGPANNTTRDGANIVINSYNAGGSYQDYTTLWKGIWNGPCGNHPSNYNDPAITNWTVDQTYHSRNHPPYPCSNVQDTFTYRTGGTSPVYTATKGDDGKDDGVPLIQTTPPSSVHDENSWGQVTPPKTSSNQLDNYTRPTTINVHDQATLDHIRIEDLRWYYRVHTLRQNENSDGCLQGCQSGQATYYKISHKRHHWETADSVGKGFLDAAVRIIDGANVCVRNSITDATTRPASRKPAGATTPNDSTDAVVVLPTNDRYTLRVAGNIDSMNMTHSAPTGTFYTQSDFPSGPSLDTIHSSSQTVNAAYDRGFQFAPPSLRGFSNGKDINLPDMPTSTEASVLGVKGNYNFKEHNAEWTTHLPDKAADHPGVIEVGERTKGTGHMHIFSGGMLKNFDGCGVNTSFPMYLGLPVSQGGDGGAPYFYLHGTEPIYIANYGVKGSNAVPNDPCKAKLYLYGDYRSWNPPGILRQLWQSDLFSTKKDGSQNAQHRGPVRIQALSDLEVRGVLQFLCPQWNDLYLLSDGGNVVTQHFSYMMSGSHNIQPYVPNYQDYIGKQVITLWAEDREDPNITGIFTCKNTDTDNQGVGNRNSERGNVYLNEDFSTKGKVLIRAANNIRTVRVSSHDGLHRIYAEKGDVYIGHGIKAPIYDTAGYRRLSNYTINSGWPDRTTPSTDMGGNMLDYLAEADTSVRCKFSIQAGWEDNVDRGRRMDGGNIYFTGLRLSHVIYDDGGVGGGRGKCTLDINIPFSNEYACRRNSSYLHNRDKDAMVRYEHSGIIGGVAPCGMESKEGWDQYAGRLKDAAPYDSVGRYMGESLIFAFDSGYLNMDAGKRGNIILNTGAKMGGYVEDNDPSKRLAPGGATFRTREGDIDMRDTFNMNDMGGDLLFLAQTENLSDLSRIKVCDCEEQRNNVYLQNFFYKSRYNSGSVFIGADNNIKLNYGGLANIGTIDDPFLSVAYEEDANGQPKKIGRGYPCGSGNYHCDLNTEENKARDFLLDYSNDSITSGGFAAVASDRIDVYKDFLYYGGTGSGTGPVPITGTLHGENVTGYGVFMKTQGNKANWTTNILTQVPECPMPCNPSDCLTDYASGRAYLHNTVRMTFHGNARFIAGNQRVHLESPVIETFGVLELDTKTRSGNNTSITIKTDSLICHDSLLLLGDNVHITTWSGLPGDQPIIKLGYSRKRPPFVEYAYDDGVTAKACNTCVSHYKGKVYGPNETPMDTMLVLFGPNVHDLWRFKRQPTLVVDHTILTFGTDSFDHVKGGETLDARFLADTLKFRHQVELFTDKKHEREGHLELISERQTGSKDYAGLYTRHLHTEPIGACGNPTSELWIHDPAIDVTTSTTLGGFGIIYSDVHVENGGHLNAGFTSLRMHGQCYEQQAGTLTTKDLRLDAGAQLHFSVGTTLGLNGEYSDAVDVDRLTTYGSVDINIEIRPCEKMEKRCYPIIYYKSVSPNSLNNLKLTPRSVMIDGEEVPLNLVVSYTGVVYVCIGENVTPAPVHTVTMPETPGVTTTPGKGIWPVTANSAFRFKAVYSTPRPLVVRTNRKNREQKKTGDKPTQKISPVPTPKEEPYEVLAGVKNTNGEYEYLISNVQEEITLTFGPDYVSNELLAGTAVWSHGEMIYIRVTRADIASIYSVAGQLVRKIDLPEGDTSIPMRRGAYVITLKDGSVHKVFVK